MTIDTPVASTQAQPAAFTTGARHTRRGRAFTALWLVVPLVYALIGWMLGTQHFFEGRVEVVVEVGGIALAGTVGVLLASFVLRQNSGIERSYSAHLEELSQRLRSLAYHDALTGLYNHRYFYEQLTHEVERAHRYKRPVSVILLDLDYFKAVNDSYGHLMGDKLLTFIGRVISDQVRGADIAARYGGDEFAIILPDTPLDAARATARKLTEAIASGRNSDGTLHESLPLGASCGVATCPDEARTVPALLQLADDRVYEAKAQADSRAKMRELKRGRRENRKPTPASDAASAIG